MVVDQRYWTPDSERAAMNLICTDINDAERFDASGRIEVERIAHLLTPDMDVLDFGGGLGRLTRHLAPRVQSVTLVDASPAMLDLAADYCAGLDNVSFARSEKPLPFADDTFAVAIAALVLFHLYHDSHDYDWWLTELHRVLKPGGLLVYDVDPQTPYPPLDTAAWTVVSEARCLDWRQDPAITSIVRILRGIKDDG